MSTPAPTIESEPQLPVSKLHPLAPIDSLNPEDAGFKPYFHQLNAVFSNPDLRNVALIGNLGSGKSSILRSYDRSRPEKQGDFLFISLIDFENKKPQSVEEAKPVQPGTAKETDKKPRQAQRLEYSLLCQILARCTNQDLSGSSLSGIPEPPKTYDELPSCLTFLFLTAFPLFFREPLGNMLRIMGIPDEGITVLHGLLLCVLGFSAALSLNWLAKLLLPRLQFQKISLKSTHAQADLALESGKHCLDQFKFELIHILDQISDKIGCTVVFEDLERLEPEVCAEIMTKLRELNTLVNTHRQTRDPSLAQKPIRFIYATSDKVFDRETRTKFFDYTIPVVPSLNATNAEAILTNLLHDVQTMVDTQSIKALIPLISPHLTDYRTLLSVISEYQMLLQIYVSTSDWLEEHAVCDSDHSKLLALATYKVLFPREYHTAFTASGSAILALPSPEKYPPRLFDLAKALFDGGYLDTSTLKMIGYSEAHIKDQWWKILMDGDFGSKSSLLFRFLHTDSPDIDAFADVVKTVVEKGKIFDFEESLSIARWIGQLYFSEPHPILEQFVDSSPSDYTPYAFINHLSCLSNFSDDVLANAAVTVGPRKISRALIRYLEALDLSVRADDIRAYEWGSGDHIKVLLDLLSVEREHLSVELLCKEIGASNLDQCLEHYIDQFTDRNPPPELIVVPEAKAYFDIEYRALLDSHERHSSFDMACIHAMNNRYSPQKR